MEPDNPTFCRLPVHQHLEQIPGQQEVEVDSISSQARPAQPSSGGVASGTVLDCTPVLPELPDCTPVHQEDTTTSTAALPTTPGDVHTNCTPTTQTTATFTGLDVFSKMMARRGGDSTIPVTVRRKKNINTKRKTILNKPSKPGPLDLLWRNPVSSKRKLNLVDSIDPSARN